MTTNEGFQRRAASRLVVRMSAALLLLGACGGGDTTDSDTTEPVAPGSTTVTTSAPEPTTPPADDVPELGGTEWVLTEYVLPNGSITNPWPDTEITLRFDSGGKLTGSGGCNTFEAQYAVEGSYDPFESGIRDPDDGQLIEIHSLAFTEMGCTPDRVMEQESEFFALLPVAGRWLLINEGSFSLRTADGSMLLIASPSS